MALATRSASVALQPSHADRLRVAVIGTRGLPARGGAERVVEGLVARLPAMGIAPIVYCDRAYTQRDFQLEGVRLVRLPSLQGKYTRAISLNLLSALHAVLFGKYDLVHLHHAESAVVLPVLRTRYRVVSTSHGGAYWRAKWGRIAKTLMRAMDTPFVRLSNGVTCVSARDARELGERYRTQVDHIPNGIEGELTPDDRGAREVLGALGVTPGSYLIFVAARIEPTKGAHLALEAVARLRSEVPLLVVGDLGQVPAYGNALRAMAVPSVHFVDLVRSPELLYGLMKSSMALVFPSTVEAMSMVMLEAAALDIPIVASDIEEIRSVLGEDVIYFACGDANSLHFQLEELLSKYDIAHRCAMALGSRIRREYSWDDIALRYAAIFREICASHV